MPWPCSCGIFRFHRTPLSLASTLGYDPDMESKPSYKLSAPAESFRPTLMGRSYSIACGHPLAALAAARVLDKGGNAVDAGVTAAMALAVLQPDIVSFAGVAPTLIYSAADRKVTSLAGL